MHVNINACDCRILTASTQIYLQYILKHFSKLSYNATFKSMTYYASDQMYFKCNSNVMAITCHIFEDNAITLQLCNEKKIAHYKLLSITLKM